MKIYVDSDEKAADARSSAYSFTIVGGIGILILVLVNLGLFPVSISGPSMILTDIVMGILFLVFLVLGIHSFLSIKSLETSAVLEHAKEQEIMEWFLSSCKESLLTLSSEEGEETLYFLRYDKMQELILAEYPDLSEETTDHIIEELYSRIFS